MCEPNISIGPQRNCVLTIGAVCGKACTLSQVAVESTHGQAEISGISSVSGDILLLLRRKLLLGATPCSTKGVGTSRGFRPQATYFRPGIGAYCRKINQNKKETI